MHVGPERARRGCSGTQTSTKRVGAEQVDQVFLIELAQRGHDELTVESAIRRARRGSLAIVRTGLFQ